MWEAVDLMNQLFAASLQGRDTKFVGEFFRMSTSKVLPQPLH